MPPRALINHQSLRAPIKLDYFEVCFVPIQQLSENVGNYFSLSRIRVRCPPFFNIYKLIEFDEAYRKGCHLQNQIDTI